MIRDITIGQYFPGKSAIHKMDPRIKILLSILYIVMLFVADNMWGLLLGVLFGFAAYLISRIPLSMIWKSMKPVVPIVIFTAVLNLFLSTGDPLWQWKFLKITREGIETAVFMSVLLRTFDDDLFQTASGIFRDPFSDGSDLVGRICR